MARPQRYNVDYFPHLLSDGKKMFYIEQKYGNDGYATWFKLLEKLAETDNHFLNLNDETEIMYLSAKCRIDNETLLNILDDLAKLNAINREMWSLKIVWSDKFTESIRDAYSKRSNDCLSLEGLRSHLRGLGILKGSVKPQSKEEKTKLKDRKKEEVVFPFDSKKFLDTWAHWKSYKKTEHDFKYKSIESEQAALKKISEISGGAEPVAIKIIMQSIENGWKGFFKLKESKDGNSRLTEEQKLVIAGDTSI